MNPLIDPWTLPIEQIDVADPRLYRDDVWEPYFARLRRDDPVHFIGDNEMYGSFWSVTKYKDIIRVDTDHRLFSSERGGITLFDDYRAGQISSPWIPPARRTAQGGWSCRCPRQFSEHGAGDPRKRGSHSGRSPTQRDLRLG